MSCDAKIWTDSNGMWRGLHDGPCASSNPEFHADYTEYNLKDAITDIEFCLGQSHVRWKFRVYPDGQAGLVGYSY